MALAEYGWELTSKLPDESWGPREYKFLVENNGGGSFSRDSSQATVTYLCEYNYLPILLESILGRTVKSGSTLSRSNPTGDPLASDQGALPEPHPTFAGFYAASAEVVTRGNVLAFLPGTTTPTDPHKPIWSKAMVTVVFRPVTFAVIGDDGTFATEANRFVTCVTEAGTELLTGNTTGPMKFVGNAKPLDQAPGFPCPVIRHRYTWHQLPADPLDFNKVPMLDTILACNGKVNATAFLGYRPGAVLMTGVENRLILPAVIGGSYYYDLTYVVAVRDTGETNPYTAGDAVGWQFVYDPFSTVLASGFDLVTSTGSSSGKKLYQVAEFNDLFVPDY